MLNSKKSIGSFLAKAGVIAGIYAVATMALPFMSYGGIQMRVSEALTLLPLFFVEAIPGLFIGCLIANLLGNGLLDIIFGSLATLVAAAVTYLVGRLVKNNVLRVLLGGLPPILINAIVVPFTYLLVTELSSLYFINFLTVGIGQFIAVYVFGGLLYLALYKRLNQISLLK